MVTEVNVTISPFLPAISKIQNLIEIQELSTTYRKELGNSTTGEGSSAGSGSGRILS